MSATFTTGDPVRTAARISELREAVAQANAEANDALQRLSRSVAEGHRDPEALAVVRHADGVMSAAEHEAAELLRMHRLQIPLAGRLASALDRAASALLALGQTTHEQIGRRETAIARLEPLTQVVSSTDDAEAAPLRRLAVPPAADAPEGELVDWLANVPVLAQVVDHLEGLPLDPAAYEAVARLTSNATLGALLTGSVQRS